MGHWRLEDMTSLIFTFPDDRDAVSTVFGEKHGFLAEINQ